MQQSIWTIELGEGPLVAAAIHDGHNVRQEVAEQLALSDQERLREEDPFTGTWTSIVGAGTRIVGHQSRFEVDLNRPLEKAVYQAPEDAWGLTVWKEMPPPELVEKSRSAHTAFYREVHALLTEISQKHGKFVVFDLHTYNHRRNGPEGPVAVPKENPEVNIGTGTVDKKWRPVVERFMHDLRAFNFLGRKLDVRENVKFKGGYFPRWIHQTFPDSGCALAVEFKKFFMDEWTGEPDPVQLEAIREGLASTIAGVTEELARL